MPTVAEKRRTFCALHESGCFVLPNPWDIGSARYLQSLGFKALATTSAGAAWSLGYPDGGMPLDAMLDHFRAIVGATDLPVNADFLAGYASAPEGVAKSVAQCIATGVAGLSIEDATGDKREPLFDFVLAVERIVAARRAVDAAGGGTILVARAECFLTGHPQPLKEAIKRLTAFAEAGADCLYAPGPRTRAEIKAIVDAVAPKPVNILARNLDRLTVADLAELGVRRVSVGGLMARMAWTGLMRSARELAANGTFDGFDGAVSGGDINALFETPRGPS
ncbi:isocitrate lyase/phosphoenolpyruvate mutase family protein [soil metagenome]